MFRYKSQESDTGNQFPSRYVNRSILIYIVIETGLGIYI